VTATDNLWNLIFSDWSA